MNKQLKQVLVTGLLVLGLGWLVQQRAEAVGPTTDSIVVSVTPSGLVFGVSISSPYAAGYNFGTVALASTTGSTRAITVTSSGTLSEYFTMSVADPGTNPWSPVSTDVTPSTIDQYELQGHFTVANAQPLDSAFVTAANADVIQSGMQMPAGSLFNQSSKVAPGNSLYLWLKLKMPASITDNTAAQRNLVLSVTGVGS
jgi:hypothetical protein